MPARGIFWSLAQTNSSMNTGPVVSGEVVIGAEETVLFLSTTVLKRVRSGGLAMLTGPASSPDTRPCSCTVIIVAIPALMSEAIVGRTASPGMLLLLKKLSLWKLKSLPALEAFVVQL